MELRYFIKSKKWRGGASLFRSSEEAAGNEVKVKVQIQRMARRLAGLGLEVQEQEKLWEHVALKKRTIGTIEDGALRRAAAACKGTTVVGADAFHPRVPLDLSDECYGRIFTLLDKVDDGGCMAQECLLHFFTDP